MKKLTILFVAMFLTVTNSSANNSNVSSNQMINIAGKQQMLSQKMAKMYLLNAYDSGIYSFKSELNTSINLFEKNLETLQNNSDKLFSSNVKKAITKESSTWNNFKAIINVPVTENNVDKVLELSNLLLKDTRAVVASIKEESYSSKFSPDDLVLDTIDKSGKQSMFSERLCLYFVAKKFTLKKNKENLENDFILGAAFKELDNSFVDLLIGEMNTIEIEESIGTALITFDDLRSQESEFLSGLVSLNDVYTTTKQLTEDFDALTSKYSNLDADTSDVISAR